MAGTTNPRRIVVTGATGNIGTSVLQALGDEPAVGSIVGLSRRPPAMSLPKVSWAAADIVRDDLVDIFRGADAVIHLAWRIQPMHDVQALTAANVVGSRRVFEAVVEAGVPALVHASSVGAYSPASKLATVDESWPTDGVGSCEYSWQKAYLERVLDALELAHPQVRVVRLRPGLVFKRDAGREIHRFFVGPVLPSFAIPPPVTERFLSRGPIAFQCVHSLDVADAFRLAAISDARGAFNVAADPVLGRRTQPSAAWAVVRGAVAASFALRVQRLAPGWVDLALRAPIMATTRARVELGWRPRFDAHHALAELLGGMRADEHAGTPALAQPVNAPTTA
jgi:UDP-glucose 4-epimerase